MFGWEFPPHISGGLGTASFGLTQGLLREGTEVIFVVPKVARDERGRIITTRNPGEIPITQMVDASDVVIDLTRTHYQDIWKNLTYLEVGINLIPYVSLEEYQQLTGEISRDTSAFEARIFAERFEFTGTYGRNLLEEVSRYALVAAKLATIYQFDVIHAHDWLTFPAAIVAQKISGKPLVVHVHATEFDRSGKHINESVYELEQTGMQTADKIITVSNLTRNVVIERYKISPHKVHTVHNAVLPLEAQQEGTSKRYLKEKIVTYLGRVTFQKGPEYFIEAADRKSVV